MVIIIAVSIGVKKYRISADIKDIGVSGFFFSKLIFGLIFLEKNVNHVSGIWKHLTEKYS